MKMKICKYCKESIFEEAVKCPKCQTFQSKFLNPKFLSLLPLLLLPFIIIPMYKIGPNEKINYIDHKEKIKLKLIRQDTLRKEDCNNCDLLNILVELDNQTEVEWEQSQYEVEFRSAEGELLNIEKKGDYQLTLPPNSTARSSIKIPIYKEYLGSEVKVNLVNLRHDRY